MRKILIAANWKMNGSLTFVEEISHQLCKLSPALKYIDVALFPPYLYLPSLQTKLMRTNIQFGAQNICSEEQGPWTGEIAASMLSEFKTRYVLVGHSERRQYYGESNEVVAQKFVRAQTNSLIPILCVGETQAERAQGLTQKVIESQLMAIIQHNGIQVFSKAVIAYEPVWAIGTGQSATFEQAQEIHLFIRELLSNREKEIASLIQILYGGSVKVDNALSLLAMPDIDGALIGGASLKIDEFLEILRIAEYLNFKN